MNAAFEARTLVASIAGPSTIGGKVKEALYRVSRATGLPERRVRGFWNGEARAILADEMDALRSAALRAAQQQEQAEASARDELSELRWRIAQLEAARSARSANAARKATDPDRHEPHGLD